MIIAGALAAVIACAAREPATGLTSARDKLSFHYDAQRTGWNDNEALLTPESVANGDFGLLWSSPQFDSVLDREPRLFASPLYKNEVRITSERAGEIQPALAGISAPEYRCTLREQRPFMPSPHTTRDHSGVILAFSGSVP